MPNNYVYVLSDDSQKYFYVGVTRRLLTRFSEHEYSNGALATKIFSYTTLLALYKIGDEMLSESDRRYHENTITLQLMKLHHLGPFYVRGGSWTSHGLTTEFKQPKELETTEMPIVCDCNLPAFSFQSHKGHTFYKCPRKNAEWCLDCENFPYKLPQSCNFFEPDWKANAMKASEPNRCKTCSIICGKYTTCYEHKDKLNINDCLILNEV